VNWSYDGIYRLTNETIALAPSHNNGSVGYGLDPVGNRLTESSSLSDIPSGASTFNADDELSSETYDQNGNVTAAGGKSFTYDSENRLVSMSASGKSVSMVYDAFGNRVAKTVNGVTTQYLVESDLNPTGYPQVFDELNSSGVVTRTYTYGLQRISENLSPALTGNSTWTPSFYGYDGGGNVRQLTSMASSVTDSYEYDAFGNSFTVSGSTPNNFLYRGEQYDPDLGLYYLRARYYNPLTGRFMSRDPFSGHIQIPQSLHRYNYASANPVNRRDPLGLDDDLEDAVLLNRAANASRFVGTIGCGISLGMLAGSAAFDYQKVLTDFNNDPVGPMTAIAGCVALFLPDSLLEGAPTIALDITGGIGCIDGIAHTIDDFNEYSEALASPAGNNASADALTFGFDLDTSILGCGLSGIAAEIDGGAYYE
jgi:RHS repeat-associated protein